MVRAVSLLFLVCLIGLFEGVFEPGMEGLNANSSKILKFKATFLNSGTPNSLVTFMSRSKKTLYED